MKKWMALLLSIALLAGMVLPAAADEEKQYDLGGRVVTIAHWYDKTPNPGSATYAEQMALIEHINEKYNCDLQFTSTGDWHSYQSVINMQVVNGEKIADAFWSHYVSTVPLWVDTGAVVALDDYFDFSRDTWNKSVDDEWLYHGKHYGITPGYDGDYALGHVILFNKRICAENGITDEYLYELQANGEWTWEKLRELAIKCTKDTNNDGEIDVYGYGSYGACPTTPEAFVYSNGAQPVTVDEDFHYTYNLDDPAVLEAIRFCYDLYWVDQVCYTGSTKWGSWEGMWRMGKTAFYEVACWNMYEYFEDLEDDEIGILLIPKGPQADDYVNAMSATNAIFMQPMVEDKEAIAAIITEWYDHYDWKEEVTVAESLEYLVHDDESLDTIDMCEGRTVALMGEASTYFRDNVLWNDWGILRGISPRTFVETMKASCQASFDELWAGTANTAETAE